MSYIKLINCEKERFVKMLKERIYEQLNREHYHCVGAQPDEVLFFCKKVNNEMRVLIVVDYHLGYTMTSEVFQCAKRNIRKQIQMQDEDIHKIEIFTFIIAEHFEAVKESVVQDFAHWIIDVNKAQLLIFEDQPNEFYNLYEKIDCILQMELKRRQEKGRKVFLTKNAIITWTLIGINLLVFLVLEKFGDTHSAQFMIEKGALFEPYIILENEYYRFFTSMFLHFGSQHLINNMLILYFLGTSLEKHLGKVKYLLLYLMSGIIGNIVSFLYYKQIEELVVSAGASGAVFGVIGALFFVLCVNKGKLEDMTLGRLGLLIMITLYYGFSSTGVDNLAHIGGLCGGFILGSVFYCRKLDILLQKRYNTKVK